MEKEIDVVAHRLNRRAFVLSGTLAVAGLSTPIVTIAHGTPEPVVVQDGLFDLDAGDLAWLAIGEGAHVTARGTIKGGFPWISAYGLLVGDNLDMAAPSFMRVVSNRVIRDAPLGAPISDWHWSSGTPVGGMDRSAKGWLTVGTGPDAQTFLFATLQRDAMMQVIYGPVSGTVRSDPDVSALQEIQVATLTRWGESAASLLPIQDDLPAAKFSEVEVASYPFGG